MSEQSESDSDDSGGSSMASAGRWSSRDGPKEREQAIGLLDFEDNDGSVAGYSYRPSAGYEGAHRFDPDFKWTPAEERVVVRRLDWKILLWVCIMFFSLQLDRGNIGQANSDNMLDDLNLDTNDFNTGQTIFFACFILAELPSQMISKWLGPERWIPIQMVSWSTVAAMQAFMTGRKSFFLCRALLGIWEGGYIPSTVLYLSYFYTSIELPVRLSFFWTANEFTLVVSSFLAYGLLHLRGTWGVSGWRWLFFIEGTLTCMIGVVSYFFLPPSPTQTASRFRGEKGWFSDYEEKIMVNRILRDDPTKGDSNNREALTMGMLLECLGDYDMWPIYLIGLTWLVPAFPIGNYLTLLLRGDGFDTYTTNLLSVPPHLIFIANLIFWTRLTEKVNERLLTSTVSQLWILPPLTILLLLPDDASKWSRFGLATIIMGFPFMHAVLVALASANAGSVRTRTVSSAVYNMACQAGNIIASNIYREDDKPHYRRGNKVLIAFCCYNLALFVGAKAYYVWKNKRRARVWDAMSQRQKDHYLATTKDRGNKR